MKHLLVFAVLAMLVSLVAVPSVLGQPIEIPLTLTDGASTNTLYFGVFAGADICINASDCSPFVPTRCEIFFPPPPPTGVFDVRFSWSGSGRNIATCYDQGSPFDYRPFTSSAQSDTFWVRQQNGGTGTMTVSWPNLAPYVTSASLRWFDNDAGQFVTINMMPGGSQLLTGITDGGFFRIIIQGPLPPPNPGPCLSLSPSPVNFGNVQVGGFSDVTVTASNSGFTNALNLISWSSDNPAFSVQSGVPGTVPASGSAPIVVRFTPTVSGPTSGNITLTHDPLNPACGGNTTTVLAVSGVGVTQGGELRFSSATVSRCDNASGYAEAISLHGYTAPDYNHHLKALQLWIVMPTNLLHSLGGIQRGSAVSSSALWNFSYAMYDDDPTNEDTARVVIYGNGTTAIAPGGPYELVKFNYGTANINGPSQTTSIGLRQVLGATRIGTDAGVTPAPDQVVTIVDAVSKGDVNGDDVIDILDLGLVVDHILGIITLTGDAFSAADVAPWPVGDGVINVLDLALLQNIILSGQYPGPELCPYGPPRPGAPIVATVGNTLSKLSENMDAKLTMYITTGGIAVRLENRVQVKGIQLEFGRVNPGAPASMVINSVFGALEGFHYQSNDLLRVLLIDWNGTIIQPGERLVAEMPFSLSDPRAVTIENVIIADRNNNRLERFEVQIVYGQAPELPTEYALYQNYPNPFNPGTTVKFAVPEAGNVKIVIYDLLGQEVRTLFDGYTQRGTTEIVWDGRDNKGAQVSTGMYVYRMTAGSFTQSRKMVLLK